MSKEKITKIKNKKSKATTVALVSAVLVSSVTPAIVLDVQNVKAAEPNAVHDFSYATVDGGIMITGYLGSKTDVVIPDTINGLPVTAIDSLAFLYKDTSATITSVKRQGKSSVRLTSVVIPDTVKRIGNYAFYDGNLTNVKLPRDLEELKSNAFASNSITSIDFNENLKVIGDYAFNDNTLTTLSVPEGVEVLGSYAFSTNKITSVTLPNSLKSIDKGTFMSNLITHIDFPSELEEIGSSAFYNNKLESVDIPETVETIGSSAFNQNLLVSVVLPSSLKKLGASSFAYNKITSVTMSENLEDVGTGVFSNNYISEFTIPSNLNSIPDNFLANNYLTSIEIPENIKSIGASSFKNNSLTSVVIPESVTTIKNNAFSGNLITDFRVENPNVAYGTGVLSENPTGTSDSVSSDVLFYADEGSTSESYALSSGHAYTSTDIEPLTLNEGVSNLDILLGESKTLYVDDFVDGDVDSYTIVNNNTDVLSATIDANGKIEILTNTLGESELIVTLVGEDGTTKDLVFNIDVVNPPSDMLQIVKPYVSETVMLGTPKTIDLSKYVTGRVVSYTLDTDNAKLNGIFDSNTLSLNLTGVENGRSIVRLGLTDSYGNEQEIVFSVAVKNSADLEVNSESDFVYTSSGGGVTITGYKGTRTHVVIPDSINGLPVTSIGRSAFMYKYSDLDSWNDEVYARISGKSDTILNSVILPETLKTVDNYAFQYSQLGTVVIPASVTSLGLNSFADSGLVEATVKSDDVAYTVAAFGDNPVKYSSTLFVLKANTDSTSHAHAIARKYIFEPLDVIYEPVELVGTIPNQTVIEGKLTTVDVSSVVTGDIENYSVLSDNTNVSASISSNGLLSLTGNTLSESVVAVSIRGKDGEVEKLLINVTVASENQKPEVVEPISTQQVYTDKLLTIDLTNYFTDADNDGLTYEVSSSDPIASEVWVDTLGTLKFTSEYEGNYTVSVKATDGKEYSETLNFIVEVTEPSTDVSDSNIQDGGQVSNKDLETNISEVIDVTLIKGGAAKVINLSGLLSFLDTSDATITLSSTDEEAVYYEFNPQTSLLSLHPLETGFSNIQVVAEDESGKVVILLMVDVSAQANAGVGYISNGTIYIGQDAYVVPLDEVYSNVEDGETLTYDVTIKKREEVTSEDTAEIESTPEENSTPDSAEIKTTSPDSSGVETSSISEEQAVLPRNTVRPLVASLSFASLGDVFVATSSSSDDSYVFEIPSGVSAATLHEDEDVIIRLVNSKLVVEGKKVGVYDVEVVATDSDGVKTPVMFSLEVKEKSSEDTGTDNGDSDGDNGIGDGNGTGSDNDNDNSNSDDSDSGDSGNNNSGGGSSNSGGGSSNSGGGSSNSGGGSSNSGGGSSNGGSSGNSDSEGTSNSEDTSGGSSIEYVDVPKNAWYYDDVVKATEKGIVQGDTANGTLKFKPNQDVTRAQATVMILRSLGIEYEGYQGESFKDTKGKWFESAVAKARDLGIVSGFEDGEFRGNQTITREHLAAIISRAYLTQVFDSPKNTFSDVSSKRWTFEEVGTLADLGVVGGYEDGTFQPTKNATRAHAVAMIMRILESDSTLIDLNKFKEEDTNLVYNFVDSDTVQSATTLDIKDFPSLLKK